MRFQKVNRWAAVGYGVALTLAGIMSSWASDAPLPPEIENPECLGINKEAAHATLMPYGCLREALEANRHASSLCRSLNGPWKFHWVPTPERRPVDFYKPGFDVSSWKDIPVPSNWQVLGYGTPYYRNAGYTIRKDFPHVMSEPPKNYTAYTERNPVGSYRRDFDIPQDWDGRRVFMTFDGVDSAFFLWVNGQKVGYSVNSRNAAEFDITPYVKPGKNMVAAEVYRYSSGTWLEDQDMWRLSGIFRNVTLWTAPKMHIRDFSVRTDSDAAYKDASLEIVAKVKNFSNQTVDGKTVVVELFKKFKLVGGAHAEVPVPPLKPGEETAVTVKMHVANPSKWTAETPVLYTATIGLKDKQSTFELLSSKVGFRKVEIKGRLLLVNGVPVKLKGVNRHEHWPEVGHAITEAQMIRDLEVIKQGNCNHVRTCHYSDDPRWYELCDEYGIWLVAEANCECHGYDHHFDNEPRMRAAIIDRNVANVENFKNRPSVIIWSLGNECGGRGKNFIDAMNVIKAIDPTRPVHYERFGMGDGNPADFDGCMYGTPGKFEGIALNKNLTKPFYLCEYAHAMFNSMGSLGDYNDVFDKYPQLVGCAIWEWMDQGLWNRRDPKHPILAYGGGFGEFPNDHYFIHKGVVASDRSPKPHYPEMKRVYQWIGIEPVDAATGRIKIRNKYQFINLNGFDAAWTLSEDGKEIDHGALKLPEIKPLTEALVTVPCKVAKPKPGAEYFMRVSFTLARDKKWAERGYEVAAAQFKLPVGMPADCPAPAAMNPLTVLTTEHGVTVAGTGFKVVFDKVAGTISGLERGGVNMLAPGGGPRLHLWRAPHRNDDMWAWGGWDGNGLAKLKFSTEVFQVEPVGKVAVCVVITVKAEGLNGFAATHNAIYTVYGDGSIAVVNDVKFAGPRTTLARLGVRMQLNPKLDRFDFLGRGPMENYSDRKRGFDVGRYGSSVKEQQTPYEKPMDCANHEDVRWAALTGSGMPGLLAQADSKLMQVSALPYTDEQMMPVEYKIDLPPSQATVLCLSTKTLGVGSAGCGPKPLEKYMVWTAPAKWSYVLRLLPAGTLVTPELGRLATPGHETAASVMPGRSHSKWSVVSCSSFEEGEGEAKNAIDGDPDTFWHSRWSSDQASYPHELVIDFGAPLKIKGIVYRGRQDLENGRVKDFEVKFSADGKQWDIPGKAGALVNSDEPQNIMLDRPVGARFMKFIAKSEVKGHAFASIGELDVIELP